MFEHNLDPGTINALDAVGVSSGCDCLEVGPGGGSIAEWLCTKIGPEGKVTAVDLNTRLIDVLEYANLEARKLNVVTEDLPRREYDLVHARFLLAHLPERESVLAKLSQTLWPGGVDTGRRTRFRHGGTRPLRRSFDATVVQSWNGCNSQTSG